MNFYLSEVRSEGAEMKRSILGSDYDGTYRKTGDAPLEEDIAAVAEFRRRGNLFGVVTGRNIYESMNFVSRLRGEFDFLLCANGAACYLPSGDYMFKELCDGELLSPLYGLCEELALNYSRVNLSGLCGGYKKLDELAADFPPVEGRVSCDAQLWRDGVGESVMISAEGLRFAEGFIQLTVFFDSRERALHAEEMIRERFSGAFRCNALGCGFDITRGGMGKAVGLSRVAAGFGVAEENVYAMGDGLNDVDMLLKFNSFSMEESVPEAHAAAERRVGGVAEAIKIIGSDLTSDADILS